MSYKNKIRWIELNNGKIYGDWFIVNRFNDIKIGRISKWDYNYKNGEWVKDGWVKDDRPTNKELFILKLLFYY